MLIAHALSLQDVARLVQAAAPLVHVSGLPGKRLPSGGFATTPDRLKIPVAQRANVFGATLPGPACRGAAQDVTMYIYHPDAMAATPDAGGGRQIKESKLRGIERQYAWLTTQAGHSKAEGADDARDAVAAEGKETSDLLTLNRKTLMVDERTPTMPKPIGPRPKDKGMATAAQWGDYRSVLPRRLGTTDTSRAGGDNRDLPAVRSWFVKQGRDHEAVLAAAEELWKLYEDSDHFDPSHLVASDGAGSGGGSGGGSQGSRQRSLTGGSAVCGMGRGGAGGSTGGSMGDGAKHQSERDVCGAKIEALVMKRIELEQRMWGSMTDHEGYNDLAARRATVITQIGSRRFD